MARRRERHRLLRRPGRFPARGERRDGPVRVEAGLRGRLLGPRHRPAEPGAPIIADGVAYFENDGYVCAFAADTGKPLWRHKPGVDEAHLLSVENGTVLFGDGDDEDAGNLYALDARNGTRLWKEHVGGSPGVIDGRLYVEEDDVLRVLSDAR
ncbi:outer membrane protein assembly factor BamB family protein [Actinomadura madurae]|uniref:outer membrane protein assembly factor BamB family protein n=1 Tax=Actinomadura madurae TaxID=1993 RepID=UPI0020D1FEC5|nr:PQQ-binding-like beta-propeller repeat protein [Actinomadura madurae]